MSSERQFHKDASAHYFLPNELGNELHPVLDARLTLIYSTKEQTELNEQARQLEILMHNNVLHAPIPNQGNAKLLDVGCGTGYVSYKMASSFPTAEVFGLGEYITTGQCVLLHLKQCVTMFPDLC